MTVDRWDKPEWYVLKAYPSGTVVQSQLAGQPTILQACLHYAELLNSRTEQDNAESLYKIHVLYYVVHQKDLEMAMRGYTNENQA